ncbi:MAG: ABC-F family ATP-binding cassette domain-containing protein [Aerococcus suis]|nr:ABC-F family ATP-binding cassette domain-containing protein [Aerococcus suis]
MEFVNVSKLTKSITTDQLFDNASFSIQDNDRIGIVGRNGTGKTTLLELIAGITPADSGTITWKNDLSVGLLQQTPSFDPNKSVLSILESSFSELNYIQDKMRELEFKMTRDQPAIQKIIQTYGEIQEEYIQKGGYEKEYKIDEVTTGLKIETIIDSTWQDLSGGERARVVFAKLLLEEPDLLLLDEPTNHLDFESLDWLSNFIHQYHGAVLVVSHDRYFLDKMADTIFEIDNQNIYIYPGNYTNYTKEREKRVLSEFQAFQNQQRKIDRMKEQIKQLRKWGNQKGNPKHFRKAKSIEKALAKIELQHKPQSENITDAQLNMSKEKIAKKLVSLENISKSYDKLLFSNINLIVKRNQRLAIIGSNGAGKSTLLKIILEEVMPDEGNVKKYEDMNIGYLPQFPFEGVDKSTVLDVFRSPFQISEQEARNKLAKFLFFGNEVHKTIASLSGGEKMRLKWAQLLNQNLDLLILDEPTNHLDIEAKETIEEILTDYSGSIIAVSHDRYFLDKICNYTCLLKNNTLLIYPGTYSDVIGKV